ncbi:MAG: nucleotidyltransferase family protein, partial [Flavisolibacter sp.]
MQSNDTKKQETVFSPGITECIILAGGLGTRLREAVPELPKAMAPVAGQPFLSYVINYLRMQGIQQFIFSLGYRAEVIMDYLKSAYPLLQYKCVIENEPLGTGGAISLALKQAASSQVLVVNGDTFFEVDLEGLFAFHISNQAACTLALKPMKQFDRYGLVELDENSQVISFKEKQYYAEGFINGGVYLVKKEAFLKDAFPEKFSFENDYLEKQAGKKVLFGRVDEGYFIDIGIPEDFQRAGRDFQKKPFNLSEIDTNWTLFLDRDGVINDEIVDNY